jgi:hypothetical protein
MSHYSMKRIIWYHGQKLAQYINNHFHTMCADIRTSNRTKDPYTV